MGLGVEHRTTVTHFTGHKRRTALSHGFDNRTCLHAEEMGGKDH